MNWKYIFNPFLKFDEKKIFFAGILGFIALNIACIIVGNKMDGILHFADAEKESPQNILIMSVGIMLSTILIYWVFGKIINRNTRFIDIANAFLLSTIPSTILILWGAIPIFENASKRLIKLANNKSPLWSTPKDLLIVSLSAIIGLPLVVYIVLLMFNGFKTATNMKKTWQIILFFLLLFILNSITQTYF